MVAMTYILCFSITASAQTEIISFQSSMNLQEPSEEEIINYRYDNPYFSKEFITIIPSYSEYYNFSKIKNEIISHLDRIKSLLSNGSDNQQSIDFELSYVITKGRELSNSVGQNIQDIKIAFDQNSYSSYIINYPQADAIYRTLLRRAQTRASAGILNPYEAKEREAKAQATLDYEISNDIIKYNRYYALFINAIGNSLGDISIMCKTKNYQC